MQEFTSANTSINSTKVPAVFKKAAFKPYTVNLDYGGGKYDTATRFLERMQVKNLIYDPYNRSEAHNLKVEVALNTRKADSATLSNVLNVIKEPAVRKGVLTDMWLRMGRGATAFITVYEGDRSSKGRQTGKDSWQNNKPLAEYLQEVREVFGDARITKGMIVAHK